MRDEAKLNSVPYWILSLVIIFYSGSAVSTISSEYRNSIVYVAASFLAWRVIERRFTVSKSIRTAFFVYFVVMIGITAVTTTYSTFYLRLFATVYLAYEISERIDCGRFVNIYETIVLYVTVIALIGYFLVNICGFGKGLPSFVNINGEEYIGIGVFNLIERLPERNCALFWEPGLFATALTFALIFELFYQKEQSLLRIILFVLGMITANSTAGYVMLVLLLVLASMKIQPRQKLAKILLFVAQIAIIVAAVSVFINLDNFLVTTGLSQNAAFAKLMSGTLLESQRGRAIQDSVASFTQGPLFGNGYLKMAQEMNYVADTATSAYAMSIFGVLGCGYSAFYITGVIAQRNINLLARIVLLIIVFGILNKEPHLDLLFTWIFGFFLLKEAKCDFKMSVREENKNVCVH